MNDLLYDAATVNAILKNAIFSAATLDYDKKGLYIDGSALEVLAKAIWPEEYYAQVTMLQEERKEKDGNA